MSFETRLKVRFADVDPAGIVFYPRYFEMLNAELEDWFADMGADYSAMHLTRRIGVPTVKLECEFMAPGMLGDELSVTVRPTRIGRSSCNIEYGITGGGVDRIRASAVLVCMDLDRQKAVEWPQDIRERIEALLAD